MAIRSPANGARIRRRVPLEDGPSVPYKPFARLILFMARQRTGHNLPKTSPPFRGS